MKDYNRKLDKVLSVKTPSTATSKQRGLSPHITYGVNTSQQSFTPLKNNRPNRNYSMTVTFFNPRFDNLTSKDISLRYQEAKLKQIEASPTRARSPKRDPILQNNEEPTHVFKPCYKRAEQASKMALLTEESVFSSKIHGEFNPIYNARSVSPKMEGKRTFAPILSDCADSPSRRRQLKDVKNAPISQYNPITEGDINGVKTVKERLPAQPSEEMTMKNNKKCFVASALGASPKGKVFRERNFTFGNEPSSDPFEYKLPEKVRGQRFSSPQPQREGIKGALEYESCLPYREMRVSPKCSNVPFSDLVKSISN